MEVKPEDTKPLKECNTEQAGKCVDEPGAQMKVEEPGAQMKVNEPGAGAQVKLEGAQKPEEKVESSLSKPEEPQKSKFITLQIISSDGLSKIHFKMKVTTHLVKLKKAYCNQMGIELAGLRFIYDGRRIHDHDTPEELEMDEDDQIEVYQEQIGGKTYSGCNYIF